MGFTEKLSKIKSFIYGYETTMHASEAKEVLVTRNNELKVYDGALADYEDPTTGALNTVNIPVMNQEIITISGGNYLTIGYLEVYEFVNSYVFNIKNNGAVGSGPDLTHFLIRPYDEATGFTDNNVTLLGSTTLGLIAGNTINYQINGNYPIGKHAIVIRFTYGTTSEAIVKAYNTNAIKIRSL